MQRLKPNISTSMFSAAKGNSISNCLDNLVFGCGLKFQRIRVRSTIVEPCQVGVMTTPTAVGTALICITQMFFHDGVDVDVDV